MSQEQLTPRMISRCGFGVAAANARSQTVSGGQPMPGAHIKILKATDRDTVSSRKDAVLKNLDYLEVQIGRLAKMVQDTRAEVLSLTVE